MGKGDRRSKKGKIWRGSFGKSRKRRSACISSGASSRGTSGRGSSAASAGRKAEKPVMTEEKSSPPAVEAAPEEQAPEPVEESGDGDTTEDGEPAAAGEQESTS